MNLTHLSKNHCLPCVNIQLQNYHQNQTISVKTHFHKWLIKKSIHGLCDFVSLFIHEHLRDILKLLMSTIFNPPDEYKSCVMIDLLTLSILDFHRNSKKKFIKV